MSAPVIVPLQRPISVNSIWRNINTRTIKSKGYRTWQNAAGWVAKSKGPLRSIEGPVTIALSVPEKGVSPRLDIDNTVKAYFDLLVDLGVIEDDSRKIIRGFSATWVDAEEGAAVITPV